MLSILAQLIVPFHKLLVGFSGGLDSTVLLHRLMLLRDQQPNLCLRAIHVHHNINSSGGVWVKHCRSICTEWDIPLIVEYVSPKDRGLGIEGEAREARYAAFASALLPDEALVTAQHLDDQCETLLLALKRGSGPTGLSAMPLRATFIGTQHLRPLLNVSRSSLEAWAKEYNLRWIEDESNQNDCYDRNFLRLRVVPLLIRRWPHFAYTVARSAQLCAEQEKLLDELLADELSSAISKEGAIAIKELQNKSAVRRAALLRRWLAVHRAIMPSRNMLTRIWYEVALARSDANPALRLNGFEIRRYQGQLWLVPHLPKIGNRMFVWPDLAESLTLPHSMGELSLQSGGQIRLPMRGEQVMVGFQARGILHVIGHHGGRKLKKIWQEYKVPPWRRGRIPLLFYGETLIAAAGIFITQEGFVKTGMQLTWKVPSIVNNKLPVNHFRVNSA